MKIMKCNNCKRKKYLEKDEEIYSCPYCKSTFIQFYNNNKEIISKEIEKLNFKEQQIEGGINMPKEKITDVRIINAKKVLEFIKTLNIEDKEVTKILNRAYNIFKNSK